MEVMNTTEIIDIIETIESMTVKDTTEITKLIEAMEATGITEAMETIEDIMAKGPYYLVRFNLYSMNFFHWLSEFEFVADFLQITDDEMVDFFFFMMETSAIMKFQSTVSLSVLFDLEYEELISIIGKILGYLDEQMVAEFRFWNRDQLISESPLQYILALKKLIRKCNSKVNTINNLKFRFTQGLMIKWIKNICEERQNLSLDEIVDTANINESMETYVIIDRFF